MEPFLTLVLVVFGGGIVTGAAFTFGFFKFLWGYRLNCLKKEVDRLREYNSKPSAQLLTSIQQKIENTPRKPYSWS